MNSTHHVELSAGRYLRVFGLLSAALLLLVGCINFWLDPFLTHQWNSPLLERMQPTGEKLTPWGKTYAIFKYQPEVLYVGNSRTHWGLPADPQFFGGERVFNGGMAGASLADAIAVLEHARSVTKLNTVVWGVDYWLFSLDAHHPDFAKELVADDKAYMLRRLVLDLKRSLSFDMTSESFRILSGRTEKVCRSSLALHGQRDEACISANLADRGGVNKVFIKDTRAVEGVSVSAERAQTALKLELDKLCREEIRVLIYINPLHAMTLENFYENGHAAELEQWKRDLVRDTDSAMKGGCAIELFDFSGFNSVTSETIPEVTGKVAMENYWEGSHYRTVVGKQILAKMLPIRDVAVAPDFGVRLDRSNIDGHLEHIRAEREIYRAAHPQELALLDKWFGSAAQRRESPTSLGNGEDTKR